MDRQGNESRNKGRNEIGTKGSRRKKKNQLNSVLLDSDDSSVNNFEKNESGEEYKSNKKELASSLLHSTKSGDNAKKCNAKKINSSKREDTGSYDQKKDLFLINLKIDSISVTLFVLAALTRFYRLTEPRNIVFDELHYGKYVSLYMRRIFFFDSHPPFGKQLIALAAYLADFDGKFKFDKIGTEYSANVPLFALRSIPALCGSLIIPLAYHFMLELGCRPWTAVIAAFLLLCDNALLTQSRFILMEPMLILFGLFGLYCILKYINLQESSVRYQWVWYVVGLVSLTLSMCIKYAGWFSWLLGVSLLCTDFWYRLLPNRNIPNKKLIIDTVVQFLVIVGVCIILYMSIFYIHLTLLKKAGPHDSVMTSAFQASLEGGLASITKGQPLQVVHGSQITLRHTHGRTCWLHSHDLVYPVRYPDKRGSSHQQQVTCYGFKDVNNWWIIKRPNKESLIVNEPIDPIKHGDVIQLVHGMTSRALNSHDVAAPLTPHNQEVSCYIDYNISMPAQNLWKVDIINKDQTDEFWHPIQSQVRLIHVNSSQALKLSGRQLPEWAYHQDEVVTDKIIDQVDTTWNVEEHRYSKIENDKDRENDLIRAEMIPVQATSFSFWDKFSELQYKMFFNHQENVRNHMYSSEPYEWPLTARGIAYWVSSEHNGQIYLLGNIVVWYSGVIAVLGYLSFATFYLIRRRRLHYDIDDEAWEHFIKIGRVLFVGYLLHYLPYFFVDRTLFLHHYLQALVFKCLLAAAVIEHLSVLLSRYRTWSMVYYLATSIWMVVILWTFRKFIVLSYGVVPLSAVDVLKLRWKNSWDFIIHKQ